MLSVMFEVGGCVVVQFKDGFLVTRNFSLVQEWKVQARSSRHRVPGAWMSQVLVVALRGQLGVVRRGGSYCREPTWVGMEP
jgi:hypothetical protein